MAEVAQKADAAGDLAATWEDRAKFFRRKGLSGEGVALGVADLFEIVASQERRIADLVTFATDTERRLMVLEPCPKRGGEPHIWDAATGRTCRACEVTR